MFNRLYLLFVLLLLTVTRIEAQPLLAPGTYGNLTPGAYTLSPGGYNLTVIAPSYSLIIQTIGDGVVTGAGSYLAGSVVPIIATPSVGWSTQSYSQGCGPSIIMPASTLICTVTFVESGNDIPPIIPPTTPWILHARCGNGASIPCSWYPSWANIVFNTSRRQLLFYPASPGSQQAGNVVFFSLDTTINPNKVWIKTHSNGIEDDRENCTLVVNEALDRAFHDGCQTSPPSPQSSQVLVIDLLTRFSTFDLSLHWMGTGSVAIHHDRSRNRMVSFGGWSQPQNKGLRTCETDATPPWSWSCVIAPANPPIWRSTDTQYARTSSQRSWREPNDVIGFVAADQNVWRYTGSPRFWIQQVTSGIQPPSATLYSYHEPTKTVVGHTPGTTPPQTWLLQEGASAWIQATPTTSPYPRNFNMPTMTYAEGCIWLLTGWSFQADLYRYCP